jgi:hypothetical protein
MFTLKRGSTGETGGESIGELVIIGLSLVGSFDESRQRVPLPVS